MTQTTPKEMIAWLERRIKQHEVRAHSKNAGKMDRAIRDFIKEHSNAKR
jgi:hypothetical protein